MPALPPYNDKSQQKGEHMFAIFKIHLYFNKNESCPFRHISYLLVRLNTLPLTVQ